MVQISGPNKKSKANQCFTWRYIIEHCLIYQKELGASNLEPLVYPKPSFALGEGQIVMVCMLTGGENMVAWLRISSTSSFGPENQDKWNGSQSTLNKQEEV